LVGSADNCNTHFIKAHGSLVLTSIIFLTGCGFSGAAKERMHKAFDSDKQLWKKRPLKEEYMLYAATGNYCFDRYISHVFVLI